MPKNRKYFYYILFFFLYLSVVFVEVNPDLIATYFINPRPAENFIVVAHRGASKHAPENTMAAFKKAIAIGANGIEFDVIFTRDDVPVVAHHADVSDRVHPTKRPAIISKMTYSEVKKLDMGLWFSEEFAGEQIPTLKDVLLFLRDKVDRIYIHDKIENDYSGSNKKRLNIFARTIMDLNMHHTAVVMVESGDLSLWQQTAPDIQLLQCWVGREGQANRVSLSAAFRDGIRHMGVFHEHDQMDLVGRLLSDIYFRDVGTLIGFWPNKHIVSRYTRRDAKFVVFTINDPLKMKLYIDAGFEAIGTDDPQLLISILESLTPQTVTRRGMAIPTRQRPR